MHRAGAPGACNDEAAPARGLRSQHPSCEGRKRHCTGPKIPGIKGLLAKRWLDEIKEGYRGKKNRGEKDAMDGAAPEEYGKPLKDGNMEDEMYCINKY